MNPVKKMLGY